ncbi:MAG: DUF4178 domain-containing protein, partial [Candidatus Obscuribacterales bacterium]|nr:DUF4178 domain-containing protein [Candidatus Obscuribacterales bacterium]
MITLSCPSCGAELKFLSKASVFAVCSFCKSTVVRHDMNLELLGKMGELQDELTPLQIGTSGFYMGVNFDIIGRLRVGYEDGFWNEWYCMFSDGRLGWLAQAQGFYAMCFSVGEENQAAPNPSGRFSGEIPDANKRGVPAREEINLGGRVALPPYGQFMVDDMHNVECKYS